MQKEIVVALMGAGRAGREHAVNLGSFPDVCVALVVTPRSRSRERPVTRARCPTRNRGTFNEC